MKSYKYYSVITGLFTAALLISNTLDTKLFAVGPFALPAGIILFPLTYLFGDILTEVYGYTASRKVIWTGFGSLALMVISYDIARAIPAAPFWEYQHAFDLILGRVPRIVMASITAYFLGEFTNSFVLAKLKVRSGGKGMAFRFIASTFFGQAVDTMVFVLVAFLGTMDARSLLLVFLSGWGFKVLWEVVMLPVSIPIVKRLKKAENEDYFDDTTDFNPFKVS